MINRIRSFTLEENGAVTVDWVVLTAGLVGLGLAVIFAVSVGFRTQSTSLQEALENDHVYTTFQEADALAEQYRDDATDE